MRLLIAALLSVFIYSSAFAAGTCTPSYRWGKVDTTKFTDTFQVKLSCTADAADASFPDTTLSSVGGSLVKVYVDDDPDGVGAGLGMTDDAVDLTVTLGDSDIDLLNGQGTNLDTTSGYLILTPTDSDSNPSWSPFAGDITVSFAQNAVNEATADIYLVFQ